MVSTPLGTDPVRCEHNASPADPDSHTHLSRVTPAACGSPAGRPDYSDHDDAPVSRLSWDKSRIASPGKAGARQRRAAPSTHTIDWDRPDWGGHVHLAENGSWIPDKSSGVDVNMQTSPPAATAPDLLRAHQGIENHGAKISEGHGYEQ
jgi:hypothetical protein